MSLLNLIKSCCFGTDYSEITTQTSSNRRPTNQGTKLLFHHSNTSRQIYSAGEPTNSNYGLNIKSNFPARPKNLEELMHLLNVLKKMIRNHPTINGESRTKILIGILCGERSLEELNFYELHIETSLIIGTHRNLFEAKKASTGFLGTTTTKHMLKNSNQINPRRLLPESNYDTPDDLFRLIDKIHETYPGALDPNGNKDHQETDEITAFDT